jgi:hypothetical protein
MLGGPRSGIKVCEPLDRQIGKSREDRSRIVAQRDFINSPIFFVDLSQHSK